MRQDPETLQRWKREMFAALLAVGLEPGLGNVTKGNAGKGDGKKDVTLFHQSSVGFLWESEGFTY